MYVCRHARFGTSVGHNGIKCITVKKSRVLDRRPTSRFLISVWETPIDTLPKNYLRRTNHSKRLARRRRNFFRIRTVQTSHFPLKNNRFQSNFLLKIVLRSGFLAHSAACGGQILGRVSVLKSGSLAQKSLKSGTF